MKRMIDNELLTADKKGVKVGKNLEVGGTTKLNGGLKPIHTYTFSVNNEEHQANYSLEIYFEEVKEYDGSYNFIGKLYVDDITYSVQDSYMILGNYNLLSEGVLTFNGVSSEDSIFTYNGVKIESSIIATKATVQAKLYRHVITLHANSTADGSCRLEYISPKDLVCDSLQDLRTVLGNPQMNSYIASNPSGDLFGVVISPSTAQIKKVGTTSLLNITSVSDTVSAL